MISCKAGVAQLVEQRTRNAQVNSSSLFAGSMIKEERGPYPVGAVLIF